MILDINLKGKLHMAYYCAGMRIALRHDECPVPDGLSWPLLANLHHRWVINELQKGRKSAE
jgi:hypothetical protein